MVDGWENIINVKYEEFVPFLVNVEKEICFFTSLIVLLHVIELKELTFWPICSNPQNEEIYCLFAKAKANTWNGRER